MTTAIQSLKARIELLEGSLRIYRSHKSCALAEARVSLQLNQAWLDLSRLEKEQEGIGR